MSMQNKPAYLRLLRQVARWLLPALVAMVSVAFLWPTVGLTGATIPSSPRSSSPKQAVSLFEGEAISVPLDRDASWQSKDSDNTQSVAWGDVDADGDLDLAVGNEDQPNRLYLNEGGVLKASWQSKDSDDTVSVAWGDVDADGDLDLAVGNYDQPNKLYLNEGGTLAASASWQSKESDNTYSVVWGDVDADGDLDLAVGNDDQPNKLYLNEGGMLTGRASWQSNESDNTRSVAWADVDADGDLDLAVGNYDQPNTLYLNEGGRLTRRASWESNDSDLTQSVAWGDVDADGDLDLAVGNWGQANKLYLNEGGTLTASASWQSEESDNTYNVAWGDVDADGDLDLAVGNNEQQSVLYLNHGGVLTKDTKWQSNDSDYTWSVAWADVDADGDLDLAVGDYAQPNKLYLNQGGALTFSANWQSNDSDDTRSVAWGDVDADGDLDLAVGNYDQRNKLYLNDGGTLSLSWQSTESDNTVSVAWGDVDADGDLDLAVGNQGQANTLYLNEGGSLTKSASWESKERDHTYSVAWADVDADGDLDLAVGNIGNFDNVNYLGQANKLYLNEGGVLAVSAKWQSEESDSTTGMAWGDVDADGDLDLAVGNYNEPNKLYLNEDGTLAVRASWQSNDSDSTESVAWGDVDADGDLDLAVGNLGQPNKLYLNEGGMLTLSPSWQSRESHRSTSVAWGDVDADGDLDLAVGNLGQPNNNVYMNNEGALSLNASSQSNEIDSTSSVAWADVDADGDLDLAVGNVEEPNKLYLNQRPAHPLHPNQRVALDISTPHAPANFYALPKIHSGVMPITYTLSDPTGRMGEVRALYSPDGGGRWLPAVGSSDTITTNLATSFSKRSNSALPIGDNGRLSSSLTFNDNGQVGNLEVGLTISHTNSSQLAAALHTPWPAPTGTTVLLFDGVGSESQGFANFTLSDHASRSIATAVGTGVNPFFYPSPDIPKDISDSETEVTVISNLFVSGGPEVINDVNVINLKGSHTYLSDLEFTLQSPAGTQVQLIARSCDDQDNFNFSLNDQAMPGHWPCPPTDGGTYQPSNPLSAFDGENSNGTWTLIIRDVIENDGGSLEGWGLSFNRIEGIYKPVEPLASLQGAPLDIPFTLIMTDSVAGSTGTLESWQLNSNGYEHVYHWDVLGSGFFGQSDNVIFRLEALPNLKPITSSIPGPFQRPFVSAQTYPFRVRGSQIRLLSESVPVKNPFVYRLPAGQTTGAKAYAGKRLRTNPQGYLEGRGDIATGDTLIALLPISQTESYTIYHTSATPTERGLEAHTVQELGVQELPISGDESLILFHLDLSLEWDARNDGTFLSNLEKGIKRASDLLYDVSNGQVAIGDVRLHQAKENWLASDIVMYAANNIRPRANMGGIVDRATDDMGLSGPIQNAYLPGQVRMGPNWDPFGENHSDLAQDWWRALAHELAHYLLFLPDNYVGISESGHLIGLDCLGSFMTNTYDDKYSEFLSDAGWEEQEDCQKTIAAQTTGRSDWETIRTFYPMLSDEPANPGPSIQPLDVTRLIPVESESDAITLPARYFDLRKREDSKLLALPRAVGYLFKTRGTDDPTDDIVVALGATGANGDRIKVRGAEVKDRVCLFDSSSRRVGCERVTESTVSVSLSNLPDWQPEILVTPVSSRTFAITVTQLVESGQRLNVQVLPAYGSSVTPALISAPWEEMRRVDAPNPGTFTQLITLPDPAFEGFVRVWVPGSRPQREAISQFYLSSAWGPSGRPTDGNTRAWAGNTRAWGAPVASGDGQVTIFNSIDPFGETGTSALQALTTLPNLPAWLTPVGQGYQVSLLEGATMTRTISFDYLQRDVPPGYEQSLKIYYLPHDGQNWQRLATDLDMDENQAATLMPLDAAGTYALLSTIDVELPNAGWNLFSYPVQARLPVAEALQSIDGYYTSVYAYDSRDSTDPWKVYEVTAPDWVNDLNQLEYGRGYWINVSQPITLSLPVDR